MNICKTCGKTDDVPWAWPTSDLCQECVHLAKKAAGKTTDDFRTLKATVPAMEFGAIQWAAKRTLRTLPSGKVGPVPLDEFFRAALIEKIREVVRAEIARGRAVPADIAAVISGH